MYIGVDIGGTKTLAAVLNDQGVITEKTKFPTPKKYDDFLTEIRQALAGFQIKDFKAGAVGIPAVILDREHGVGVRFGNLPWRDVPIQNDIERLCNCPVAIENDAKLAGLSEAMLLKDKYQKVLYVTVSTGIGAALIAYGVIDANIGDGGGRTLLLEHKGRAMPWEDFAGGRAIVERFGKKASDITDDTTWKIIARDLARGFIELIALTEPEVIVIGGSVGTYFERYAAFLRAEIEKYHVPLIPMPVLMEAQRPEEAVVYGCYDLAKQIYGHGKTTS